MDEKQKCQYCGKPIEGEPVKEKIYINGRYVDMIFCSKDCAAWRQMGAEG